MGLDITIPAGFPFAGKQLLEIITPESLQSRINELGKDISNHYQNKIPIIIGVLNGAFLFMADLILRSILEE